MFRRLLKLRKLPHCFFKSMQAFVILTLSVTRKTIKMNKNPLLIRVILSLPRVKVRKKRMMRKILRIVRTPMGMIIRM
jgi:hypothetical protein